MEGCQESLLHNAGSTSLLLESCTKIRRVKRRLGRAGKPPSVSDLLMVEKIDPENSVRTWVQGRPKFQAY